MQNIRMEKSLSAYLISESSLAGIFHKIESLKVLNALWQNKVDADLVKHSFIANQREDVLIIEVDSAAFATRLRYSIPDIILNLSEEKEFLFLKKIEWYICPSALLSAQRKKEKRKLFLSDGVIQLLNNTAENMANEKLRKALLKLAEGKNYSG